MRVIKWRHSILLLLAAIIWGTAFVAQSNGMKYIQPFTFVAIRSFLGSLVLIPIVFLQHRASPFTARDLRSVLLGGLFCGLALMSASVTQQFGLQTTSVGKAGFISTLYIILVPIFGLFLRHRCRWTIWIAVFLALVGLSFLCLDGTFRLQKGDLLLLASAALFAVHILTINHFVTQKNAVFMACLQFFTVGLFCLLPAVLFEHPTFQAIFSAKYSLLYAGLFSSGIAFTLQIVGQRGMNPTVASLLMSLESVVSVAAGFLFLGQIPSARELIGCGITLIAVIIAQIDFPAKKPVSSALTDKDQG